MGSIPITPICMLQAMSLGLLLIIIGIVLAVLVSWVLGLILILIGVALLLAPNLGRR